MLGERLDTLPFDLEVADEYAARVNRLTRNKLSVSKLFQGAMGELAFARWDSQETYERCVHHLRTASEGNRDDFSFDFADRRGRPVDPKSNSCDNVLKGWNSLLVTQGKALDGVLYVSLDALVPSCRAFEFTGYLDGARVREFPTEVNKQTGNRYHKVPTGRLILPKDW